jgi:hypothetical protein
MATKPKTATIKRGKRRATKPQPLPKSVKALLGYLSGSDMKLSNNSRAKIAPSQAQNLPQPIINNNYYN